MVWIFRLFAAFYLAALGYYLAGTFGWTGQGGERYAAEVMRLVGMPWTMIFRGSDSSVTILVNLLSPALNLGLVWIIADIVQGRED